MLSYNSLMKKKLFLTFVVSYGIASFSVAQVVVPDHVTNPMSISTGQTFPDAIQFTIAAEDQSRPSIQGFNIDNLSPFTVNAWTGKLESSSGWQNISGPGGAYNPNGNYTYIGYTTWTGDTNRTEWYVNEEGWSVGVFENPSLGPVVHIRAPVDIADRFIGLRQNAQVAEALTSLEGFIAGDGQPFNYSPLEQMATNVVDWNYNFSGMIVSPYTPASIFGAVASSGGAFVEQAQELNVGLTFEDGQWTPAQ
jgi:hypothetical protein